MIVFQMAAFFNYLRKVKENNMKMTLGQLKKLAGRPTIHVCGKANADFILD
jgi:hypothetical protein